MNKLEKAISKWNFKKIAVWYLVLGIAAGLACAGTLGFLYWERLNFAWQYSRLAEAKDEAALKAAAEKTAAASGDVVDVLILDGEDRVTYSAKGSEFADGTLALVRTGSDRKYLASADHPDAVFRYAGREEFMLQSVFNRDFGELCADYEEDSAFDGDLAGKTVYMLGRVGVRSGGKVYVISIPTTVSGGRMVLKATAALAMLFFCIYWVLVALWMYRDAARCRLSPLYWGMIGLFTNLVGLLVYKIYRRSMAVCTACGAAQSADHRYCSFCGKQLGARCESCGGKVGRGDGFCCHCGEKLK